MASRAELSDAAGGEAGEHTPVGRGSAEIARLGVGGTSAAIAAVARGDVTNAYALVWPPGHHAERDRGRGFCISNSVALGVMSAIDARLIERVAVVDWDVHHGNGTQQAFYSRADSGQRGGDRSAIIDLWQSKSTRRAVRSTV